MSPNIPPVFEALPAEVLGNILRQVASPEDLYSTIRASPNAFGSFRCFRESIIIEVLQAHLPAEIFSEYLGLLNTPKYENFNYVPNRSDFEYYFREHYGPKRHLSAWESCRYRGWHIVLKAFFETHFRNVMAAKSSEVQRYSLPNLSCKKQINYMISMYGMLRRFIRDYQSFVRSIPTGSPPPLSDLNPSFRRQETAISRQWEFHEQVWPPLNQDEAIRLQRGFLRYELCSRSNAIPTLGINLRPYDGRVVVELDDSASVCLQRWEEEEIRCVWTYVRRQYQVLIREVVAEFRCDVRRLSREARGAPDNEVTLAPRLAFHNWSYNMSCLGLPMLQQVLRSGFDDQRRFLKSTALEWPELDGALSLCDPNDLGDEWNDNSRETFRNRRMTDGETFIYTSVTMNLARWATDDQGDLGRLISTRQELEEIGWVFWEDLRRLDYLGWHASDTDAGKGMNHYLRYLGGRNQRDRFEAEDTYPEKSMYVTWDSFEEELSSKYAVGLPAPGQEHWFLDRLRDISDWSSKETSPAFEEICRGPPTKE